MIFNNSVKYQIYDVCSIRNLRQQRFRISSGTNFSIVMQPIMALTTLPKGSPEKKRPIHPMGEIGFLYAKARNLRLIVYLLNNNQQIFCINLCSHGCDDSFNNTRNIRNHIGLHFHGFDRKQNISAFNLLVLRNANG